MGRNQAHLPPAVSVRSDFLLAGNGEHIRGELGRGADDETDILPYAREQDLIIVTSDVTDFGPVPSEAHAGIVLLYDDAMPAYRVASGLLAMVDAYGNRAEFGGREELDPWA
ncbi:DUF5615 family PIN-like protein [Halostella sp. JP-L12]|uniref:DUF5615 family PIN-like protein n=1 Tax=Halostella TaxID=1843185 RepID=UPI0013CF29E4|nr:MULTISPECIES: DUF5615 family PIN-like protein [Halostella]NHN47988.1 DUF5615 family PIN-like protein [Halostella sp. JP-L12]